MERLGELAALSTALLWAFTAIFFAEAGKLVGSFRVNKVRLIVAILLYSGLIFATTGFPFPRGMTLEQVSWLALSGVVGLAFGDGCGFKALVMIGPRLTTLFYSTAPIIATLVAWIFLGERLTLLDIAGILLTVSGVAWVVFERRPAVPIVPTDAHPDNGSLGKGILLAIGAAAGQGIGLVLAKQGMSHAGGEVPPHDAAFVRMCAGAVLLWGMSLVRGEIGQVFPAFRNKRALGFTAAGAFVGPFLGVWMSLVAISLIPTGIAATLNSITPILILPLVIRMYKEKVTYRAAFGTVIVVAGVALLLLQ